MIEWFILAMIPLLTLFTMIHSFVVLNPLLIGEFRATWAVDKNQENHQTWEKERHFQKPRSISKFCGSLHGLCTDHGFIVDSFINVCAQTLVTVGANVCILLKTSTMVKIEKYLPACVNWTRYRLLIRFWLYLKDIYRRQAEYALILIFVFNSNLLKQNTCRYMFSVVVPILRTALFVNSVSNSPTNTSTSY